MKKIVILAALVCSISFSSCKKTTEDTPTPATPTPTTADADADGVIEKFTFDAGTLNATRRSDFALSVINAPTVTATDRKNQANKAVNVPFRGGLSIDNLPMPLGNASRSLSFWVSFNGNPAFQLLNERYFVSCGSRTSGQAFGVRHTGQSGQTVANFDAYAWGTGNNAITNYTPSTSTGVCGWVHLAYIYNQGENKLKFYINGVLKSNTTPTSTMNTTGTSLRIGLLPAAVSTSFETEAFLFDDLIVYNRAITQAEITALANDTSCQP